MQFRILRLVDTLWFSKVKALVEDNAEPDFAKTVIGVIPDEKLFELDQDDLLLSVVNYYHEQEKGSSLRETICVFSIVSAILYKIASRIDSKLFLKYESTLNHKDYKSFLHSLKKEKDKQLRLKELEDFFKP